MPRDILIASPSSVMRRTLARAVRHCGYAAVLARGSNEAQRALRRRPILAVLVSFPPQMDRSVVASLRSGTDVPILVLMGGEPASESDVVSILDAGADECVRDPVGVEELGARLRAVVRRGPPADPAPISTAGFTIDLVDRQVWRDGVEIRLTPIEWRLVEVLAKHAGHLVGREHLLACVWGPDKPARVHTLRVHMPAIRRKLEPDRATPCYFITIPGLGVRFRPGT